MHPNVQRSIIYKSQAMESRSASINRWMDREGVAYIYTHNSIYSAIKKWNFSICNNMNGPGKY